MSLPEALAAAEAEAPGVAALVERYGPTALRLATRCGPALLRRFGPMLAASARAGTLADDLERLLDLAAGLQPLVNAAGELGGLADGLADGLAATLGAGRPARPEEPAMARVSPTKPGGR